MVEEVQCYYRYVDVLLGVGCGESRIGTGSPLQKGCLAAILPKAVPSNWDTAFPSNHAPVRDVLCWATPRL